LPIIHFNTNDLGRKIFYVTFALYLCLQCVVVAAIIFGMNPRDPKNFLEENPVYLFYLCAEPVFILLFAFGCLISGIRLQKYVISVGLESVLLNEFLVQLNIVLFLVTGFYLIRALFVFALYSKFGDQVVGSVPFWAWILCTRWLPSLGTSCCLFIFMSRRYSSASKHLMYYNKSEDTTSEPLLLISEEETRYSGHRCGTVSLASDEYESNYSADQSINSCERISF
jgi:hypothetical protein